MSSILHVEDDASDRLLFAAAFKRMKLPVTVESAGDGQEAIERLSSGPAPRLVLLDLKMPRRSGFEVLEWIRSRPGLEDLPVFILTSSEQPDDVQRAYTLGANAYLVKDVDVQVQRSLVRGIGSYLALLDRRAKAT